MNASDKISSSTVGLALNLNASTCLKFSCEEKISLFPGLLHYPPESRVLITSVVGIPKSSNLWTYSTGRLLALTKKYTGLVFHKKPLWGQMFLTNIKLVSN